MSNQGLYCIRNPVRDSKDYIEQIAKNYDCTIDLVPVYCMKLCMVCKIRHVLVINQELIVAKDEDELSNSVKDKLNI